MADHQRKWWWAHTVGGKLRCPECGGIVLENFEDLERDHEFEYTILSGTIRQSRVEPAKPMLRYSCVACGAEIRDDIPALERHNPDATRTSEGCPNKCSFCGVKIIHPIFKELPSWKVAPIICDDNLTACSRSHFNKVIDIMKPVKNVDINQGLDARLLQKWQLDRLQELHLYKLRFAWDNINQENKILETLEAVINAGFPKSKIHVYVLFNHNDTPEDTLYRCETLWGMGVVPNVQRFQPLDCLMKNQHIDPNWNDQLLRDFTLYWSRRHLPIETHRILRLRKVMDYIRGGQTIKAGVV